MGHLHGCFDGKCHTVLVGPGRKCGGHYNEHVRKRLVIGDGWSARCNEGAVL